MTKQELINKYGEAWYERYKARMKERYQNDPEYRESEKIRGKERYKNDSHYREFKNVRRRERYYNDSEFRKSLIAKDRVRKQTSYVKDGQIDLIENYELAAKDNFERWEIHHRIELHPDNTVRFTRQSLINLDLYYDRPPSELIWLSSLEHRRMHSKGRTRT